MIPLLYRQERQRKKKIGYNKDYYSKDSYLLLMKQIRIIRVYSQGSDTDPLKLRLDPQVWLQTAAITKTGFADLPEIFFLH